MKIKDAIDRLQKIAIKHGDDVHVYFDCPRCGVSFHPAMIATTAIHIGADLQLSAEKEK